MRGTCVDITDRVLADRERERIATRFQGLVDAAPDAILVLGERPGGARGQPARPRAARGRPPGPAHRGDPPGVARTAAPRASTPPASTGRALRLDVITVGVDVRGRRPGRRRRSTPCSCATRRPRLEGEALAARLGEAQLRRRQALEINDNVVQGLVAAVYALDQGEVGGVDVLPRPHADRGPRDDGRPARPARRCRAAARRPGPDRARPRSAEPEPYGATPPHRRTSSACTASWSSTTPRTCGCCCAPGWSPTTA